MKNNTRKLVLIALAVAINIAGSKLSVLFSLPIFLDSIGTILTGMILGPLGGAGVGLIGGLVNGVLGDIYSIYFSPSAIIMGLMAGLLLHNRKTSNLSMLWKTFLIVLPASIVSAFIETVVFGGVTSATFTTAAIAILSHTAMSLFGSAFITQLITDYVDKLLAVALVRAAYKHIPDNLKHV